jgi:hypothetical protein
MPRQKNRVFRVSKLALFFTVLNPLAENSLTLQCWNLDFLYLSHITYNLVLYGHCG